MAGKWVERTGRVETSVSIRSFNFELKLVQVTGKQQEMGRNE